MNAPSPSHEWLHAVKLPDESDLRGLERKLPQPHRLVGAGIAALIHVAVLLAILYGGGQVLKQMQEPVINVDLISEDRPVAETPPAPPQFTKAPVPIVPVPIVSVMSPPAQTIRVTADTPPADTPPSQPSASAETRQSYFARVLAHLNRYKRYPAEARRAHVEGVVMLHFVMDRAGRVLGFDIATSSGKTLLDGEALALIARAQPLPSIPPEFGRDRLDVTVPIEFSLH